MKSSLLNVQITLSKLTFEDDLYSSLKRGINSASKTDNLN